MMSTAIAPTENGYVSVFQTAKTVDEMYRNAQIFASSTFVPDQFRNKPEDCMIALDLAFSLGIKATTIFPNLYVINRRPALAAQFMIALVNRSGQFSRIQWEEGTDGTVEYERFGRTVKVPNYYAQAYFTELATGEKLYSTRVDIALAKANGWLTKNESKWQTIPREMARWRSAAWLVKNYAPEVVLGFEFADELADATAETTTRGTVRATPRRREIILDAQSIEYRDVPETEAAESEEAADVADFMQEMNDAETIDALQKIAEKIAVAKFDGDDVARLRDAFIKRRAELQRKAKESAAQEVKEEPTPEPKQEPPKRSRKAKKESAPEPIDADKTDAEDESQEQYPPQTANALKRIRGAKNVDELDALVEAYSKAEFVGEDETLAKQVIAEAIQARYLDFEDADSDAESEPAPTIPPTQLQKERATKIRDGLYAAKDRTEIEHWRKITNEYLEKGFITKEQKDALDLIAFDAEKKLMV